MEKKQYLAPVVKMVIVNTTQLMAASGEGVTEVKTSDEIGISLGGPSTEAGRAKGDIGIWDD